MKRPIVSSLGDITLEQAGVYMRLSRNDEVAAAMALALDRNLLEGLDKLPDATEVHHALFLLRRARGMEAPSFDDLRVSLRTKGMAA